MRRTALALIVLASMLASVRAEEVTSEDSGEFLGWVSVTEHGFDGQRSDGPARIYLSEGCEPGTKLLGCTKIHISTSAWGSVRISLLRFDWETGERVPRWPDGPPPAVPLLLETGIGISVDGMGGTQYDSEVVEAALEFVDGEFAYYGVDLSREEEVGPETLAFITWVIQGFIVSPNGWPPPPMVTVRRLLWPAWEQVDMEPDWQADTWGEFIASVTVTVEPNDPPVAAATADPVEVAPGDPVTFSAAAAFSYAVFLASTAPWETPPFSNRTWYRSRFVFASSCTAFAADTRA